MHRGGRAVDKPAELIIVHLFAVRRNARVDGLLLPRVQHGNRPHEQLPAGLLVGDIVSEILTKPGFARFISFQPLRDRLGGRGGG